MAETNRTAKPTVSTTSVQAKKSSNAISWLAPLICIIAGYVLWRFVIGSSSNFRNPDPAGGFWPDNKDPKTALSKMYLGGIIVPILIGCFLVVFTFVIERLLTVLKAAGRGSIADFIRKVQYQLANKNVDAALAECDRQKG